MARETLYRTPLYLGEKSPERDTLVGGVGYLIFRFWAEGIP
jgi:hypothetical protein